MIRLPIPRNETERLSRLSSYHIVVAEKDERLDELTDLAASIFEVPMVIITILDQSKQWFKSRYGLALQETSRDISFCQYTIMEKEVFEVTDSLQDERFKQNPLVVGEPYIRFYGGAPLISREGYTLGSLGLLDRKPRQLDRNQRRTLQLLARQVVDHFELSRDKKELELTVSKRTKEITEQLHELALKDRKLEAINAELTRFMYKTSHDLQGPLKTMLGLINLAIAESGEETVTKYLHLLKSTQSKLDATLEHLLTVVRVKGHEPGLAPVPIESLVLKSFQHASAAIPAKKVHFQCRLEAPPELLTDSFLLGTALEHLFFTSIRHNYSTAPLLNVNISPLAGNIKIAIEDNGSCFPEAEKDRVFDMFFKSSASDHGLGLYIAKCAVERLQGKVSFISHKHRGTTFSLLLPAG